MQSVWPFNSARHSKYRHLAAEPVSEERPWEVEDNLKGFNESQPVVPKPASRLSPVYTHIALLLLISICAFETCALILQNYYLVSAQKPLLRSPVPSVVTEVREFTDEPSLHGLRTTAEVEAAWEHLRLPVSGFVYLPRPQEYDLLPNTNVIKGAENVYSVSAYHQLHCLKIMHLTFVQLWNQEEGDERMRSLEHIEHCIAYIKQGVTCAGDTVLEGPDIGGGTLQGWGIKHECRTWEGEHGLVDKIEVLNQQMFRQQEATERKLAMAKELMDS